MDCSGAMDDFNKCFLTSGCHFFKLSNKQGPLGGSRSQSCEFSHHVWLGTGGVEYPSLRLSLSPCPEHVCTQSINQINCLMYDHLDVFNTIQTRCSLHLTSTANYNGKQVKFPRSLTDSRKLFYLL